MQATRYRRSPMRALTAASLSAAPIPTRSEASSKLTDMLSGSAASPATCSSVGPSARPTIIRASPQHFFSSGARWLEDRESAMKPVNGDLVRTANLLEVVKRVPTNGLPTKSNGLSGPNGSTPGGQ